MQKTYSVTDIHCGSCAAKITAALSPLIADIKIDVPKKQVTLNAETLDLSALNSALAKVGTYQLTEITQEKTIGFLEVYAPLLLILGYISMASFAHAASIHDWMIHFMAGFFMVFSFFKLLDVGGFANAYATYDVLAKKFRAYGLLYPFLELGLGVCYLFRIELHTINIITLVLMGFSSIGVIGALLKKQTIRCACLGTVLKLPMSAVTLVEDIGMAAMAAWMLIV
jgi:copper chaperone CopZ